MSDQTPDGGEQDTPMSHEVFLRLVLERMGAAQQQLSRARRKALRLEAHARALSADIRELDRLVQLGEWVDANHRAEEPSVLSDGEW